ncbi:hypothetical protein Q0Z83_073820 [Actinoplanes sichuanensis]|uniref:Uncharacterized protein n=1 Tax=Actinoplanes sichuanensis TaxID=512349 RepID=A0ABW4A9H1_9ACTN|nr:hypothetical protein [Actinoplanes sichuanensis]BEL09191.1 hypothetical protein Q0Z83_073820 [Actinoplanes sichuanensis]
MTSQNEERRPPADQAGEAAAKHTEQVTETASTVRHDRPPRRPADRVTTIDYHAMGFDLGYAERAAIGSALLVLERAE